MTTKITTQKLKKPPVPREALKRAANALRFVAGYEVGVSQGPDLVNVEDTQEWKDAARIEKWLKATK